MPIPFRLRDLSEREGKPLEEIIPAAIEKYGTIHWAAVSLNVSPNSLKYWLKKNGYVVEQKLITVVTHPGETHV
jgi:hypothetical protein